MGCGFSHDQHQNKLNDEDEEEEQQHDNNNTTKKSSSMGSALRKRIGRGKNKKNQEEQEETEKGLEPEDEEDSHEESGGSKKLFGKFSMNGGSILVHSDVSDSQVNFFKMLDEKIENGHGIDESEEDVAAADRQEELLRSAEEWEGKSLHLDRMSQTPSKPETEDVASGGGSRGASNSADSLRTVFSNVGEGEANASQHFQALQEREEPPFHPDHSNSTICSIRLTNVLQDTRDSDARTES